MEINEVLKYEVNNFSIFKISASFKCHTLKLQNGISAGGAY